MLSVNRNLVVGVRQRLRDVYVLIQKGVSVTLLSPGQSVEADCETFHRFQLWCVFSNATGQTTIESCSAQCNRRYNLTGTFLTETFVRQAGKKKSTFTSYVHATFATNKMLGMLASAEVRREVNGTI